MSVIVSIQGREAIPVRAIPFLTDWMVLSPDRLALSLSGNKAGDVRGLTAYRLNGGAVSSIKPRYWTDLEIKMAELEDGRLGYGEGQPKAVSMLPASVFVWKNDFEDCFNRYILPKEDEPSMWLSNGEEADLSLDWSPVIEPELLTLVMEGFVITQPVTLIAPATPTNAGLDGPESQNDVVEAYLERAVPTETVDSTPPVTIVASEYIAAVLNATLTSVTAERQTRDLPPIEFDGPHARATAAITPDAPAASEATVAENGPAVGTPDAQTATGATPQQSAAPEGLTAVQAATAAPVTEIKGAVGTSDAPALLPASESRGGTFPQPESLKTLPTTRKRERDLVSTAIEAAQRQCDNSKNANQVWMILADQAEKKIKPFLGITDEGLKWLDSNDASQFLTMKNLRDRIARQQKKAS